MAFGFFRRRQKMVVIIMAVLMVSFLVGFQGFQMIFSQRPSDVPVGRTSEGQVKNEHIWAAQSDIGILRMLGLANNPPIVPTGSEFLLLTPERQREPALAYALLLMEAEKEGVTVRDGDVQNFFSRDLGMGEAHYKNFLAGLRTSQRNIPERRVRRAVRNWLMIHRTFVRALVASPPSEQRARHIARDLLEQTRLRVLRIRAEKFLDEAPEPDPNRIEKQLVDYRSAPAGVYPTVNSFGFGYLVPDQVRILYALVSRRALRGAARPPEKEIDGYYDAHKDEFLTEDGKQKTIAAAWDEIVGKLSEQAAAADMKRIVQRMTQLVAEYPSRIRYTKAGNPYEYAKDQMTVPQEDVSAILDRKVTVRLVRAPIEQALAALAKDADLDAISYPRGQEGKESLDPNIEVTIEGQMTLGDALKELCRQARWPEVRWGAVVGIKALFPPGDADFPIVVKLTPPMSIKDVRDDKVLRSSVNPSGQTLLALAFNSEPFAGGREIPGMLKLGQDGPVMAALGEHDGALLWRLVAARPAHAPAKVTDDMKQQATEDLKIEAAFAKAYDVARKIDTAEKFEAALAGKEFETEDTGLFARKVESQARPGALDWSSVTVVKLPRNPGVPFQVHLKAQTEILEAFLKLAFSPALLPADVEPPFPAKSKALAVMRLPAKREILVLRRIGYQPLVTSAYEQQYRTSIFRGLAWSRRLRSASMWFDTRSVAARMEFQRATP